MCTPVTDTPTEVYDSSLPHYLSWFNTLKTNRLKDVTLVYLAGKVAFSAKVFIDMHGVAMEASSERLFAKETETGAFVAFKVLTDSPVKWRYIVLEHFKTLGYIVIWTSPLRGDDDRDWCRFSIDATPATLSEILEPLFSGDGLGMQKFKFTLLSSLTTEDGMS